MMLSTGDAAIILDTQGADKFHVAVDDSDSNNLMVIDNLVELLMVVIKIRQLIVI